MPEPSWKYDASLTSSKVPEPVSEAATVVRLVPAPRAGDPARRCRLDDGSTNNGSWFRMAPGSVLIGAVHLQVLAQDVLYARSWLPTHVGLVVLSSPITYPPFLAAL